ncbi:NUDIX domain-containing protein [Thalassorhabdus alkalitolerans]|uniref:NUDIX domain-containing protein n=1 Tax=Thalassorhabdus alkalitolerans TaxID=2282697 RepID=A0ABW0YG46_9BACI
MQRVTNCVLKDGSQVLMLQKPRRGWWVVPGGKMETGESTRETAIREFREETGLHIKNPAIKGIFTILIIDEDDELLSEWMMFTFLATEFEGEMLGKSPEGKLAWKEKDEILTLPMAPGDRYIFEHILNNEDVLYGTFRYTPQFKLLSYRLQSDSNPKESS